MRDSCDDILGVLRKIYRVWLWMGFLVGSSWGQIVATFETSKGNFDVNLLYQEAPLATTNFILLAGKADDIFETASGVPDLNASTHSRHAYRQVVDAETDSLKLPLNVYRFPGRYVVQQAGVVVGTVSDRQTGGFYPDLSGLDRIRLETLSSDPFQYRVTLRYPRPYVDRRFMWIRDARDNPLYKNIRVTKVEPGRRFFAGTLTNDPFEHPGYVFQDEVFRLNSADNWHGGYFNSPFILAMDSRAPNQNGSRFFITTVAEASWNGRYTPFGVVLPNAGRSVVQSIVDSPLDEDGFPEPFINISRIRISRIGAGPTAFFEGLHQQKMPGMIRESCGSIQRGHGGYQFLSEGRSGAMHSLYQSTDLLNYTGGFFAFQRQFDWEPFPFDLTSTVSAIPKMYFRSFTADILDWPATNFSLENAALEMEVTSGMDRGSLNLSFHPDGNGGSYVVNMIVTKVGLGGDPDEEVALNGNGTFIAAHEASGPYRSRIEFSDVTGPLSIDEMTLYFDSNRFENTPGFPESALVWRFGARKTSFDDGFLSYSGVFRKTR